MVRVAGGEESVSAADRGARKDSRWTWRAGVLCGDAVQSLESGGESLLRGRSAEAAAGEAAGFVGRTRSNREIGSESRAAFGGGRRGGCVRGHRQCARRVYDAGGLRQVQRTVRQDGVRSGAHRAAQYPAPARRQSLPGPFLSG